MNGRKNFLTDIHINQPWKRRHMNQLHRRTRSTSVVRRDLARLDSVDAGNKTSRHVSL